MSKEQQQTGHWREQVQVQIAIPVALAVVAVLLWPLLRPDDPRGPVTFLSNGSAVQGVIFSAAVAVLAGCVAVVTVSSRPQGALLAALIGAAGISLRSPSIRALLWRHEGHYGGLYGRLAVETVFLLVVLVVVWAVAAAARAAVGTLRPAWLWREPAQDADEHPQEAGGRPEAWSELKRARGLLHPAGGDGDRDDPSKAARMRTLYCLLLGTLLTAVFVLILARSDDRRQVLFAVFAGSTLGFLVAHQKFPAPVSLAAWPGPMLLAVVFYALAGGALGGEAAEWQSVPRYAQALPIDWMTLGAGGATLGYWFSARIHETRHTQTHEEE